MSKVGLKVCTTRKVSFSLGKWSISGRNSNLKVYPSRPLCSGRKKVNTNVNNEDFGPFLSENKSVFESFYSSHSLYSYLRRSLYPSDLIAILESTTSGQANFGRVSRGQKMSISTLSFSFKEKSQTQFCSSRNRNRYLRQRYTVANPLTDLANLLLKPRKDPNGGETRDFCLGFSQLMYELPKPSLVNSIEFTELPETGNLTRRMTIKRIKEIKDAFFYFQPDRRVPEYRDESQVTQVIKQRLQGGGDIESNPGPQRSARKQQEGSTLMVTSYNVRGLNDEAKLRHLVNYCYSQTNKDRDHFFLFQETFLTKSNKIPYLWRGNFHLTPGCGNSSGCVSLLSSHISVVHSIDFGMKGHLLVCQKSGDQKISYIVANIYAPCPNNQEKIVFFEEIFDKLNEMIITFECNNVIVAGDFNLNFNVKEVKNRNYSAQERRIAQIVNGFIEGTGLIDVWKEGASSFTWKRANTDVFSTIDRIFFSRSFRVTKLGTNWSLSLSDHAAVELGLTLNGEGATERSKITRLDPSLLKDVDCKNRILDEFESMMRQAGNDWNPHLKLEYAKMCIRTITEKVQAERKRRERSEEDGVNEELNLAITSLERDINEEEREELIEYVEELRNRKAHLIEEKGQRLAHKLGTKWYNEGEKSTRYFLNLLNRPSPDRFKSIINSEGVEISTPEAVSEEIVGFYKSLYENYDKSHLGVPNIRSNDEFFNHIQPISGQEENEVTKPITIQELERTLISCRDSAPGPDGIPYSFYRALWRSLGPILVDAWNHSIRTGNLCPSHKVSFLKLIPKAGKDLKKLTNWRPITLSNCDHKLITKTYSNRMSKVVAHSIKERQTAYLKGRLINDNVRALLSMIELTNEEKDLDGLLVSLDAKKAFDSVEHGYIEECLIKFGLANFVPIFRILYKELRSDIIINGKLNEGFRILRGVKQGDALSCIIFIMCMEPLLRNIKENPIIGELTSNKTGRLPKAYAYADDVNSVIVNSERELQAVFNE